MPKLIITDVDDTVLVCKVFLNAFLKQKLNLIPNSVAFDIKESYGIDEITAHNSIHEFWRSDIMARLPPEPCALEVLPRLYAQGWRFVAITACANEPDILEARKHNLRNVFGFEWEAVHCTGYHSIGSDGKNKKAEFLAKYEPTIWVEDNFKNALAGAQLGHKSFLINRDHNESDLENNLITRVNNWYEIEEYIKEL